MIKGEYCVSESKDLPPRAESIDLSVTALVQASMSAGFQVFETLSYLLMKSEHRFLLFNFERMG